MKELKPDEINLQDHNHKFVEEMWQISDKDLHNLTSIVYWTFGSVVSPDQQYYFIKNWLLSSNYREKIAGKLNFGGLYKYIGEIDTGNPIEYGQDGALTSESWNKIFEFKKELNRIYTKEFI